MATVQFASLIGLICVIGGMIAVLTQQARLRNHPTAGVAGGLARVLTRLAQAPSSDRRVGRK